MFANRHATSVLWRCIVERGEEVELVDVMTEGAAERSGCSTQLNSAWLRRPASYVSCDCAQVLNAEPRYLV